MTKNIKLLKLVGVLGVASLLAACGNTNNDIEIENPDEQETVVVGTSGSPRPITYVDENGELTGFEIELLKEIGERSDKYDVEFDIAEFPSVIGGLDAGRYQIAANNFKKTPEREEKYLFSNAVTQTPYAIAVKTDNNEMKTLEDIGGHSTITQAGQNLSEVLENYNNQTSGPKIDINYSEADMVTSMQEVNNGRYDFILVDEAMGRAIIEEQGLDLKLVSLSDEESRQISDPHTYFLFQKTEASQELADEVNLYLEEMNEDGSLSALSEEFLGDDYIPKDKK